MYWTSGRRRVIVFYEGGKREDLAYARYIMQEHIGKKLNKNEHVDHINGDFTDDRIENLQVLSASDHKKKHNARK